MLLRELEVEKYWSFPSSYDKEKQRIEIANIISSKNYSYQLKTDGNYSAFICDFDGEKSIISRGISKVTGTYSHLEDKLFFFKDVAKAFNKPTRIMGEIWLEGAVDKNIGSILRSLTAKSLSIQDEDYYTQISKTTKFSAKDKRDIEKNSFRNQKLKWRIFDVWYYDGIDLMQTPWIERQEYVKRAAEKINNPLVSYVPYYPIDENIYDKLAEIFEAGEEGIVCYNNNGLPEPGKRTAHKTLKLKREIENNIDCFITGIEPATKIYTGKEISHWPFWENQRTGLLLRGEYFEKYKLGESLIPVTKNYYYNWPGAIYTAVYDSNGNEIPLCKVSGLTEDFKNELRDNYKKYDHCPVTITGMNLSDSNGISVRHPKLISIRLNDLNIKEDCTLEKIFS